MEEVMDFIMRAFELAKNLELELPNITNNLEILYSSIDDVEKAFSVAKERVIMILSSQHETATLPNSFAPMLSHDVFKQKTQHAGGVHGTSMDQLLLIQQHHFDVSVSLEMLRSSGTLRIGEIGGRDVEGLERPKGPEAEIMQGIEAPLSRPKKSSRKIDLEKRTVMIPATQVGNTEMPPEDGFTWRKYGQKEILGRKHPRSYYRCTHQKLYLCPAKKQVQRLDDYPNIIEVTYRGEHICHKSLTAPSSYPSQQQLLVNMMTTQTTTSPSLKLGAGTSGGPSTSRYAIDFPVADMADAMFNSGSSSGNSMESLFHSTEDKWELADQEKKN